MLIQNLGVFSAYAEVFLLALGRRRRLGSFLRVRGGVSFESNEYCNSLEFSPRTRRCFFIRPPSACTWPVFSAYAEVFLPNFCYVG